MQTTDYEAGKQPLDPPYQPWTDGWLGFMMQPTPSSRRAWRRNTIGEVVLRSLRSVDCRTIAARRDYS
jgi:hypothetical protein